jgi:hypothetical protein
MAEMAHSVGDSATRQVTPELALQFLIRNKDGIHGLNDLDRKLMALMEEIGW